MSLVARGANLSMAPILRARRWVFTTLYGPDEIRQVLGPHRLYPFDKHAQTLRPRWPKSRDPRGDSGEIVSQA